jgi:exonuclease III
MDLQIGTWNVKASCKTGSLKALLQQLQHYHMQITAIQETKWVGNNVYDTGTYTIMQSGKQKGKREFGLAFIVDKVTKNNILAFTPVNKRICVL